MRVSTLLAPVVLTGLVVLAACSGGRPEGGDAGPAARPDGEAVRLDEHRTLGTPLTIGNLRVWPVHSDAPLDVGEFLTLSEAQAAGVATIREVGSGSGAQQRVQARDIQADGADVIEEVDVADPLAGGDRAEAFEQALARQQLDDTGFGGGATVGTLVVENRGDIPILILAGTIVKGGNQDRQLGQDIVVDAGATVPVEAFCVEQGRWSAQRAGVATAGEFLALDLVTNAAVRKNAQYTKDQGAVWYEVVQARSVGFQSAASSAAAPSDRRHALEPAIADSGSSEDDTSRSVDDLLDSVQSHQYAARDAGSTLVDVLENADPAVMAQREETAAAITSHFRALASCEDAPVGFAYAIGDQPVTVRTFAHARLLAKHVETFANSMALDASLAEATDATCTAADVVAMVSDISTAAEVRTETGALNHLGVRESETGWNGNCYVNVNDRDTAVPLTQDWSKK